MLAWSGCDSPHVASPKGATIGLRTRRQRGGITNLYNITPARATPGSRAATLRGVGEEWKHVSG